MDEPNWDINILEEQFVDPKRNVTKFEKLYVFPDKQTYLDDKITIIN